MNDSHRDEELMREAMAQIDLLLDRSRAERLTMLGALAQSRPDLHLLVMDLLENEESVNRGFMEPGNGSATRGVLRPDARLGPYRILSPLGEGGMGEVWLARRDDGLYEGQVAIKTLHPYFAGGALRDRFLREAKVLGRLAHANIARLLDAGIHDGIVYLVLEYVQGRAIDTACNEKQLDVSARLKIFLQLCAGVAHAHSSLVIHRDIKPGNVLLTDDGVAKLLDFGIANFFEPETASTPSELTRLTGRIFTPEYAAPEQVSGQEITTATDVYSLGVLLYALLTGRLPYEASDRDRARWEHIVLHQEPQRLVRALDAADHEAVAKQRSMSIARLRRELGGDLENIVQKALKKRPEDRYSSVATFADDIRRYLRGEPVFARADSSWYRLKKFAQRNRLAVGAATAVVVALGIGLVVSLWQLQVARSERRRAEESREFIASIFRSADPFYTGNNSMSAVDLLTLARQRIDRELASQPKTAVELLTLVGESQRNLSEKEAAKATLSKAIELAERLQPRDDVLIAEARGELMVTLRTNYEWAEARALAAKALPDLRKHQPRTGRVLSAVLFSLGYIEADEGNREVAVALAREGVAAVTVALGPAHSESISGRYHLGHFLKEARKFDEALGVAKGVLHDAHALAAPGERGALLIQAETLYGSVLVEMREYQAAIPHLNTALELTTRLRGTKDVDALVLLSMLGRVQQRLGDFKALLVTRRRAFEAADSDKDRARMLTNLARATLNARQVPDALELLSQAIELEMQHDSGKGSWLYLAQSDYGAALALSGRFEQADSLLKEILPPAREAVMRGSLASTLNAIGLTRQLQSQWKQSEEAFREAFANTDGDTLNVKHRGEALLGIGISRLELGQAADAENWLRQAGEQQREFIAGMTPLQAEIAMNLGRALLAQGKVAAANESFAAANAYWLDYDASNRGAGLAAYWAGQGQIAAGSAKDGHAHLTRAIDILATSPLPGDLRLVKDSRQLVARR